MLEQARLVTVSVYGVYFNSLHNALLVQDSSSGLWGFPGGRVEAGETHDIALRRELLEETGCKVVGSPIFVTQQYSGKKHRYFYRIKLEGRVNTGSNGTDIDRVSYFDTKNLPANIAMGVKAVIAASR